MNPFGLLLVLCVALCAVVPASGAATDQQSDAIDAGLNTRNKIMIRKQHASSDDHADAEKGDQMYAQVTAEGRISYHSGVADDDDQGDELDHNVSLFEESDLNDEYDPTSLPNSSLLDAQSSRSGWWSRRRRRRRAPRGAPGSPRASSVRGHHPGEAQGAAASARLRSPTRGGVGARGSTGPRGAPGAKGATGPTGDRGDKGDTPKPIDCVWADWAAYSSDCTQTCGTKANPGSQVRSRSYKVDPQNGGKSCEGPMFERAKCSKVKACPTTTTTTTTTGAAKSSTMSIRASCRTSLALLACASMSFLP
ncbi:unnamed protein product [Prorocentrum cordatum]|uniref:Uncharacterized protein n=1 Tax=Prorocentrum cordatum TaxID=2364126 RepID=A0ABN9PGW7_9DINO|nr:unnamed protein product [Polarella glacialis]